MEEPILHGTDGRELLREAIKHVRSLQGTTTQKANLFERLSLQIMQRTGGSWNALRLAGTDGSHIFIGRTGELLIINPAGVLFRGHITDGLKMVSPNRGEPVYQSLREIK